ncbi:MULTISPECIES: hypothetical protein [Marinobacter]|nr:MULTISPECIES: hypothetical protein [Marinobacter]
MFDKADSSGVGPRAKQDFAGQIAGQIAGHLAGQENSKYDQMKLSSKNWK